MVILLLATFLKRVRYYAIVRPSVCLLSVICRPTFVRPTQAIEIFANVSTLFGIPWPFVTFP